MTGTAWTLASYAMGSIPTGYWLGLAWRGIDVRRHGSGNLGATNVFRVLGPVAGATTLLIDILKGWLPVFVARAWWPDGTHWPLLAGIAAVLGHTTSPWVGFRGGKGVATAAGMFLALMPWATLGAVAVFGLAMKGSGYVSLGSLLAAATLAVLAQVSPHEPAVRAAAAAIAILVFWTHRQNMRRLLNGTENRIR